MTMMHFAKGLYGAQARMAGGNVENFPMTLIDEYLRVISPGEHPSWNSDCWVKFEKFDADISMGINHLGITMSSDGYGIGFATAAVEDGKTYGDLKVAIHDEDIQFSIRFEENWVRAPKREYLQMVLQFLQAYQEVGMWALIREDAEGYDVEFTKKYLVHANEEILRISGLLGMEVVSATGG